MGGREDADAGDDALGQGLSEGLRHVLNQHGHAFQAAVLQQCVECGAGWQLAVEEYALSLGNDETHVDFILGSGAHLIVAECKRTRSWRWGFAQQARRRPERPRADFLAWWGVPTRLHRFVKEFGFATNGPYDVAIEVKAGKEKGQPAFDQALRQVMKARGALIDELGEAGQLRYAGGAIVPVIFTTANLAATQSDLAAADLQTGNVEGLETTSEDWLWFDYNLPRSLWPRATPTMPRADNPPQTKSQLLLRSQLDHMSRSVAVVNVNGIGGFLQELRRALDA